MDRSLQEPLFKEIAAYRSDAGDRTRLADHEMFHPTTAYMSDEVHEAEKRMMKTFPLIVGHGSSIPEPGDYLAHSDVGMPLMIVRQKDGGIKAFLNACRHRGAKVCGSPQGSAKIFTCPYHGWSYATDGALRRVPHDGFPDLDVSEFGLQELPSEERHGLLWVIPTPGADIDVAAFLGPVDDELAQYPLDRFVLERDTLREEGLNWKFVLDGFLEIYHIPVLHRESIAPYFFGHSSPFDRLGLHSRLVGTRKSFDEIKDMTFDDAGDIMGHVAVNYQVFPNTIIVWQQDHFEVWTSFPGDTPRDCRVRILSLVSPEMSGEEYTRRWDANWKVLIDTVNGEDWAVCREIQDALPHVEGGTLVFGRNEPGMQHFHQAVTDELADRARLTEQKAGQ